MFHVGGVRGSWRERCSTSRPELDPDARRAGRGDTRGGVFAFSSRAQRPTCSGIVEELTDAESRLLSFLEQIDTSSASGSGISSSLSRLPGVSCCRRTRAGIAALRVSAGPFLVAAKLSGTRSRPLPASARTTQRVYRSLASDMGVNRATLYRRLSSCFEVGRTIGYRTRRRTIRPSTATTGTINRERGASAEPLREDRRTHADIGARRFTAAHCSRRSRTACPPCRDSAHHQGHCATVGYGQLRLRAVGDDVRGDVLSHAHIVRGHPLCVASRGLAHALQPPASVRHRHAATAWSAAALRHPRQSEGVLGRKIAGYSDPLGGTGAVPPRLIQGPSFRAGRAMSERVHDPSPACEHRQVQGRNVSRPA